MIANLHTFMTESLPKTNILLGFRMRINVLPHYILKDVNIKKKNILHVTGPYSELTKEGSTKQLLLPHALAED